MPRYFLHIRRHAGPNGLAVDPEGDDLADENMLREHVLNVARGLVATARLHAVSNWYDCVVEVTDESGWRVMAVPFSDLVPESEPSSPSPRASARRSGGLN